MVWFPDAYTIAFRFVQDNPLFMLGIALVACALCWYQALGNVPPRFRSRFAALLVVVALGAVAYVSVNFASLVIAEAMVFSVLVVYLAAMIAAAYDAKNRDT
jgi:hypothetical protein